MITPKIGARLGGALKEIIPAVKRGDYEVRDGKLFVGEYELNADEFEKRLTVRDGVTGAALPDNTAAVVLDTEINADLVARRFGKRCFALYPGHAQGNRVGCFRPYKYGIQCRPSIGKCH